MNVLLVYGTLSGSSMAVAERVQSVLKSHGHSVEITTADLANKQELADADSFIVGSPSWEDQGKDGQPLPEVIAFLASLAPQDFANKKVAVFGLGDTAYPHFCGAVDIIEGRMKNLGVQLCVPSLRIDRYYSFPDSDTKVDAWAENLSAVLV